MKKDDLLALNLTEEVIEKLMVIHGRDIEGLKASLAVMTQERDTLSGQLGEANAVIAGFEGMTPEKVKATVTEWKTKAEEAASKAAADIAALKFSHRLETLLKDKYRAKNVKALSALLSTKDLKLGEDGESITGLEERVKPLQESDPYLFESTESAEPDGGHKPLRIVTGGRPASQKGDVVVDAFRAGARIPSPKSD